MPINLKLLSKVNLLLFVSGFLLLIACQSQESTSPINRLELVSRHNVILNNPDTLGSLTIGNGNFAYTVDVTGMQTFHEEYENGISLGTMSNWGWHTVPSDSNFTRDDVAEYYESCNEKSVPYAIQHRDGRAGRATQWLRQNPHRLHLGIIGLELIHENGEEVPLNELTNIDQKLDLWTGIITSEFEINGIKTIVESVAHQGQDQLSFRISSPLIQSGQLKIKMAFPYGANCHVCPGYDWNSPDRHSSILELQSDNQALIKRELDTDTYSVGIQWNGFGELNETEKHHFEFSPSADQSSIEINFLFIENNDSPTFIPSFETSLKNSTASYENFWKSGGAIDLHESTDPRAQELERRIVLSQYLTKVNCSGNMPPQETGLTMNSWYGKFHLEMHWWHGVHFALWGRPEYLEKSLDWYKENLDQAKSTAQWQGYDGARWQKMTTPEGLSSPSGVGEFLVWQQPHIIYFAELLYRNNPSDETLHKYENLINETASFMASFAQPGKEDGKYHLCPPLIPAQEHFKATETSDPTFELSYWYWGLKTAQVWNERLGKPINKDWQKVIDNLAPIPQNDEFYLPTADAEDAYSNFEKRRDHPIVLGAYGFLPNERVDTIKMKYTFEEVMNEWNWASTWGWDYPLLAMTATRLHQPEKAIDALFTDTAKNTYLVNGHNYQDDRLRLYLPGNGGLLAVTAMMCAGFEGNKVINPGFPKNENWVVKWEGLKPMF